MNYLKKVSIYFLKCALPTEHTNKYKKGLGRFKFETLLLYNQSLFLFPSFVFPQTYFSTYFLIIAKIVNSFDGTDILTISVPVALKQGLVQLVVVSLLAPNPLLAVPPTRTDAFFS